MTPLHETMRGGALMVGLAAFVLPGLMLLGARAEEPSATPSGDTKPAPVPESKPDAGGKLRSLEKEPPPEGKTAVPKLDEWKSAERVALLGHLPTTCKALLVREWLQIRCANNGAGLAVISGSSDGVTGALTPLFMRFTQDANTGESTTEQVTGSSVIQFPIRRGDRRIIEVTTMEQSGYGGAWQSLLYILSEQWLDDQPGAWVTVSLDR